MKKLPVIFFLSFIIIFTNILFAQDDVYLKAISGGIKKINISVFDMLNETETESDIGKEMTSILKNDLELSGIFSLIPAPQVTSIEGIGDSLDYIFLETRGAEYLLKGTYNINYEYIDVNIDLQHIKTRQNIIDKEKYELSKQNIRWGVHKIADDVVYALTGEQGIAQTKIAFVSKRTGNKEIYIMDYDGANIEQITFDNAINISPRWSPDGKYILYSSMRDNYPDIYKVDIQTKEAELLIKKEGGDLSPAWSPDNKLLAFSLSFTGNAEIFTSNIDGSNLKQITFNPQIDISPSFSPSGKQIAFVSRRAGSPQIYIMNRDGTNLRRLTYYGNYNQTPSWSPRGDRIAFISLDVDADFDIYTIDVTGENIFQLTDFTKDNEDPCWSPDGLHITFCSTRGGMSEIYLMNWDGTDQTRITSGGDNTQPNWSPRLENIYVK